VSGGKCHDVRFLEAAHCRPRSATIRGPEHSIAECPAVSGAVPVRIDGNALDFHFIQTQLAAPIFPSACNDRQTASGGQVKGSSHFLSLITFTSRCVLCIASTEAAVHMQNFPRNEACILRDKEGQCLGRTPGGTRTFDGLL
jgi:hypothetical protein